MSTKCKKGFTIIEIIVAIAIFSFIAIAVSRFQTDVLIYNKFSADSISSAQDAQVILRAIVKELRSVKPSSTGAYPIEQAATSTLIFFSNIDSDSLQERVRYFISGTELRKGTIKPSGSPLSYNSSNEKVTILAYNIKNGTSTALFEYFDSSYAGTSTPLVNPSVNLVRLVRVNLLIDADPRRSPIPRVYTSDATLRNIKDNL